MNENSVKETQNEDKGMEKTTIKNNSRKPVELIEKQPRRLIFEPPFFEIAYKSTDGKKFILRCYTCGERKRVTLNNSYVAKMHLKRYHPDIFIIFENNKRKNGQKIDCELMDLSPYSIISELEKELRNAITNTIQNMQDKKCLKEVHNSIGDEDIPTSSNNVDCNLFSISKANTQLSGKTTLSNTVKEKLMFSPPFFQIIGFKDNYTKFSSRCYTCGQLLSCHLTYSASNLKLHLKRRHPVLLKLYEKCNALDIYPNEEYDVSTPPEEILSLLEKQDEALVSRPCKNLFLCYAPPFFEITSEETLVYDLITARCCTCGKSKTTLCSDYRIFRQHLGYCNPNLCQIYDRYKHFLNFVYKIEIPENDKQKKSNKNVNMNRKPQRLIFTSPFFKIVHQSEDNTKYSLICYTCGEKMHVPIRNLSLARNHLKLEHPDIFKIYEKNRGKCSGNKTNSNKNVIAYKRKIFKTNQQDDDFKTNIELRENEIPSLSKNIEYDSSPTTEDIIKTKVWKNKFLFTSQFFKLVHKYMSGKKIVRCYSCGKLMNAFSTYSKIRLTQHIQRYHPDMYKIYRRNSYKHISSSSVTKAHFNDLDTSNNILATEQFQEDKNETIEDSKEPKDQICKTTKELGLSNCNLENLEEIVDQSLKNLVEQTGYFELKNKVMKIVSENEVENKSSILELKSDVESIREQCSQLRLALRQYKASKKQLQNELQKFDNFLHERKLIIKNIKIINKKQPLEDVDNLLKLKLNLHKVKIINCAIITKPRTSKNSSTETVLIELQNAEDFNLVLSQVYKLDNTDVLIEPELSPEQRKHRNKLLVISKELLNRKPKLKVLVQRLTLVVNGKNFYWDDTEGLCHNCYSTKSIDIGGVEYLNNLTGLDVRNIVNILQKYEITF